MNNNIKYLILGLAVFGGLSACTKQLVEEAPAPKNTHTVYFSSGTAQTKTGITVGETEVTPDWNKTALESIHLFEIDANDAVAYGETIAITPSEDNATAHFEADFPTDMSIIVNPSNTEEDSGAKGPTETKGTRVSPYRYAAIIAKKPDKNNFTFVVPSEQHPDAETLIDPDADFLIGYSRKEYDDAHIFTDPVVDLYFDRPVALGRIIISSFEEGEKVKSVVIKAPGLSGSAAYSAIDFENAAVTFTPDVAAEGETAALTLDYGDGAALAADGTFGAYFVALPGKTQVSEIVVTTDQYIYTKTVGKEITFSNTTFKNLTLNLSDEGVTKVAAAPAEIKWYKASVLEDGIDYIIVSNGYALKNNGSKAVVAAQAVEIVDGTISLEETDGLIWTANANSEFTEYGTHTLSNGTEHLWRHSDNGTFTLEANNEAITKYMVWNYDGEYLWNISIYTGSGSAQISDYYAYYSSGWKISTTKTAATLFTSRAPQELAFTPAASAEYDLATSEWTVAVPTLSGAQTSVTYSLSEDSNPAVATVDADGTVHPLSKGTVTIVATAEGNAQYQAATATYSLKVIDSSITTKTYNKVTSTGDLTVGDQYLLVYESTPSVFKPILDGSTFKKHKDNVQSVTISSNSITSTELVDYELTLTEGYHLYVGSANMYLYPNLDGSTTSIGAESSPSIALNITIQSDGIAKITNSTNTTANLCWSTNNSYFSTTYNSSAAINVCLYKLEDNRPAWTMSYSPTEATYDLYTRQWTSGTPSLSSNATTTVTYTSSNENVATVNASGVVTPIKKGSATITATADADATHKKTEASFALTVDDTTPVTMVTVNLKKATSISAGKQYVLVSNGKALVRNGSDAEVYDFNSSDLTVSVPSNLRDNLEWTLQSSSNLFKNGDYYFGIVMHATGTYTYRVQLSTTTTNIDGDSNDSMPNLTIDTSGDYIYYTGNSSAYFMYFDTSEDWTTYKITKANSYTHSYKTALYEVVDSRTPQELVFSSSSAEYDLGTSMWTVAVPSLSGAINAVTYESSDPTVATVTNAGVVTPLKKGITTITARAAESATYQPGEASYKLTVKNSLVKDVYQRVTSTDQIVSGGKYIFVYENGDTKKAFKPVLNSGKTAFEQTAANAIDVTITNDEIDPSTVEGCQIVFSNQDGTSLKFNMLVPKADGENDYYFCLRNNSSSFVASTEDPGYRPTIALDSNGVMTISRSQNSSNYRFRYSSSNSSFQASTSSSSNLYLFKLEDGSNP